MWREVLPGGLKIDNLHIPQGYDVGTGIYSIHHNSKYYPEPFKYTPERWIPEIAGKEAVENAKGAYSTFSIGPRNCVGKGLAMIEISLAVATVISDYDFRAAPGDLARVGEGNGAFKDEYQTFWAFTSIKDGPYIQFKKHVTSGGC
jgi:cytochrome P450